MTTFLIYGSRHGSAFSRIVNATNNQNVTKMPFVTLAQLLDVETVDGIVTLEGVLYARVSLGLHAVAVDTCERAWN